MTMRDFLISIGAWAVAGGSGLLMSWLILKIGAKDN